MAADNSKIVYGGDLMLFIGTGTTKSPLAFSTSAKLSVSTKVRDISSKDSGNWTDKTVGKFDWNTSTDGLLNFSATSGTTGIDTVYSYFISGTPINIVFGSKTGTTPNWTPNLTLKSFSGTAIITSIDVNGNDGDNATYSITLEGNSTLALS
jgi:predicted secreted protein